MAKVPLQSSRSVSTAEEVRYEQKQVMLEEEQDLSPREVQTGLSVLGVLRMHYNKKHNKVNVILEHREERTKRPLQLSSPSRHQVSGHITTQANMGSGKNCPWRKAPANSYL